MAVMTTAQALVKFLDNQYVSFDGKETKFVDGIFTIFGHGIVCGLGEALDSDRGGLTVYQGKKLFLLNLPYLLFVYPFDKLAQAFRLAPGADLSGKLLSIGDGFTAALSSPWLSFQPTDLLIGIAGAVILRMAVYLKGKNAKKYRHGIEYGSARWSA